MSGPQPAAEAATPSSVAAIHLAQPDLFGRVDLPKALRAFWGEELEHARSALDTHDGTEPAMPDLPLSRIKRIMKADEDVRMIAAESAGLMARACELFVQDAAIRSYAVASMSSAAQSHASSSRSAKKQHQAVSIARDHILGAAQKTDAFDFLVGVLAPGVKPQYLIDIEQSALAAQAAAVSSSEGGAPSGGPGLYATAVASAAAVGEAPGGAGGRAAAAATASSAYWAASQQSVLAAAVVTAAAVPR